MTTFAQIEKSIREIAAENPNHVYRAPSSQWGKCVYIENGSGSCIVGRACVANGASVDALSDLDNGEGTNGDRAIEQVFGIVLTPTQSAWVKMVQRRQDNGTEWGEAVAEADSTFPLT